MWKGPGESEAPEPWMGDPSCYGRRSQSESTPLVTGHAHAAVVADSPLETRSLKRSTIKRPTPGRIVWYT